jgi:hypothetical protein
MPTLPQPGLKAGSDYPIPRDLDLDLDLDLDVESCRPAELVRPVLRLVRRRQSCVVSADGRTLVDRTAAFVVGSSLPHWVAWSAATWATTRRPWRGGRMVMISSSPRHTA